MQQPGSRAESVTSCCGFEDRGWRAQSQIGQREQGASICVLPRSVQLFYPSVCSSVGTFLSPSSVLSYFPLPLCIVQSDCFPMKSR